MNNRSDSIKTALVLPGGGARGAFQVGVLKALAEVMPKIKRESLLRNQRHLGGGRQFGCARIKSAALSLCGR